VQGGEGVCCMTTQDPIPGSYSSQGVPSFGKDGFRRGGLQEDGRWLATGSVGTCVK